jgi:putative two-component system response regulator
MSEEIIIDPNEFKKVRILIVEDVPVNIKVLRRLLERLGYQTLDSALYAEEALELIRRKPYDIYIIDANPSGKQLFKKLRDEQPHVGIVCISADSMNGGPKDWALNDGADVFWSKPIRASEIEEHLRTLSVRSFLGDLATEELVSEIVNVILKMEKTQ